jgi:broad specificity phosphatase PhoE
VTGRVVALLRHGETPFHGENRYAGQSDVPLNDTGRAQAARLAEWAATASIASVWASDLSRSVDTAQGVATASGLVLNTDARLRELDFGIGDGLTTAEMRERFPAERAAFERNPEEFPLPGGERPAHAVARAKAALADAIEESAGASGIVVVIAHSTLLRLLTLDLIGVPLARYRAVFPKIEPGSGIILRTDGRTGGILTVNAQLSPGFQLEGY